MREREPMQHGGWRLASMGILLILMLGCRNVPPNLKPAKEPQALNLPPEEPRYATGAWPEKVVAHDDTKKKTDDTFGGPGKTGMGSGMPPGGGSSMGAGPGGGVGGFR